MEVKILWILNDKGNRVYRGERKEYLKHHAFCIHSQMEDNLEREKKVRADVEKAKRKLEQDLKSTQGAVEDLERVKGELEGTVKKWVVNLLLITRLLREWEAWAHKLG